MKLEFRSQLKVKGCMFLLFSHWNFTTLLKGQTMFSLLILIHIFHCEITLWIATDQLITRWVQSTLNELHLIPAWIVHELATVFYFQWITSALSVCLTNFVLQLSVRTFFIFPWSEFSSCQVKKKIGVGKRHISPSTISALSRPVCPPPTGLRNAVFRGGGPREEEGRHQHQRNVIAEGEASSWAFFILTCLCFFPTPPCSLSVLTSDGIAPAQVKAPSVLQLLHPSGREAGAHLK